MYGLGLPPTSSQLRQYITAGDYLDGYNTMPNMGDVSLSTPKLGHLYGDTFKSCVAHRDKRQFNWKAFGAMLLALVGGVWGTKYFFVKSGELVKDAGKVCASGVKGACVGTANGVKKTFSFLNPKNWFKKNK